MNNLVKTVSLGKAEVSEKEAELEETRVALFNAVRRELKTLDTGDLLELATFAVYKLAKLKMPQYYTAVVKDIFSDYMN